MKKKTTHQRTQNELREKKRELRGWRDEYKFIEQDIKHLIRELKLLINERTEATSMIESIFIEINELENTLNKTKKS